MIGQRKLFKTKLCVLYQKGRCSRPSCSFAHGSAELRRFSGSFDGRRDYRGGDLRNKLDGRHSPLQERDSRGRHEPREYRSSWSIERESERKRRKKEHGEGHNDISGNLRISDRSEERDREGKIAPSTSRDILDGQLDKMQADIDVAEHHKHQAEVYLEEKIQEVDSLTSRIQELESQLYKEREECKRIKSKIKKFVKAHNRYSRIQDELKRSQVRLQQLGDQLGSDISKLGTNEEDSSINIVSDGEEAGCHAVSPLPDLQKDTSASKKKVPVNHAVEDSKQVDLNKGSSEAVTRLARFSRWNAHPARSVYSKFEAVGDEFEDLVPTAIESKQKRGKTFSATTPAAEKVRGLELSLAVPLTSMAAHAVDEIDIELEANNEVTETAVEHAKQATSGSLPFLPLPPPPPIRKTNHSRYEGEDQNIDIEVLDEERARLDVA